MVYPEDPTPSHFRPPAAQDAGSLAEILKEVFQRTSGMLYEGKGGEFPQEEGEVELVTCDGVFFSILWT